MTCIEHFSIPDKMLRLEMMMTVLLCALLGKSQYSPWYMPADALPPTDSQNKCQKGFFFSLSLKKTLKELQKASKTTHTNK